MLCIESKLGGIDEGEKGERRGEREGEGEGEGRGGEGREID